MTIPYEQTRRKFADDPGFIRERAALEDEFTVADAMIRARIAAESRGEKLPDVESLARRTRDHEVEQAQAERPDRLQS